MSMEACFVSVPVSQREQMRFGEEQGWMDAMRSRAAHTLANMIIAGGKALYRQIDPTEEELRRNPDAPIRHQWTVGLESGMEELAAREAQIEEGRIRGRAEAAAICAEAAQRYQNQTGDGMCKWVIADALNAVARSIQQS
jgi:hypothetical protein